MAWPPNKIPGSATVGSPETPSGMKHTTINFVRLFLVYCFAIVIEVFLALYIWGPITI
jgi:hypothetical protein